MRLPQLGTQPWTPTNLRLPRGHRYDPWVHAELLGLQVLERPLEDANEYWSEPLQTIYLRESMRPFNQRIALAHGIAHMVLEHPDDRPKYEFAANRLCSLLLIDPRELDQARLAFPGDNAAVAIEVGVTPRVLAAYLGRRE